jgi:glucose-6-phosphate isomerase
MSRLACAGLEWDLAGLGADRIGAEHGITAAEAEHIRTAASRALRRFEDARARGAIAFARLDELEQGLDRIVSFAERVRGRYDDVVHIGIGGSALGALAILSALRGPLANLDGRPRVHVLDNVDPEEIADVLDRVRPGRTLLHVVSKSGSTIEMLVAFRIARARMGAAWKEHTVVTTDPEEGYLRRLAASEGLVSFPIPKDLGGRYSLFTAVGMLPAALSGVDIRALVAGARRAQAEVDAAPAEANAPLRAAAALAFLCQSKRKPILVQFVYARGLRETGAWFVQLWSESLGKDGKGQTPVLALGATDQHSILQLLQDGPNDKVVWFVYPRSWRRDEEIPAAADGREFLDGRRVSEVIAAEREGVEAALGAAGRPTMAMSLPRIDPPALGAAFYQWMAMTVYSGYLMGVNPFDQPGVEAAKKHAVHRLSRAAP